VAVAIRLAADGSMTGPPRRSPSSRVFIEGGRAEGYAISLDGLRVLRDDPEQRATSAACATSFRFFLRCWRFLDQESGTVRTLGESLWPAQEAYLDAADAHPWLFMLKARQLGETTIAIAYDGWVARFRDPNARVHVFSTGDDAAKEVLDAILFGLERLPPSMRLPLHSTTRSIRLDCGGGERAFIRSYPSTRAASRGSTANHLHLDEWSAMLDPRKVMQSVAPTVAPGATFHILTTEVVGPESDSAAYYRKCVEGDGKHAPLFVPALSRPGRDADWLEGMRRSMPRADFAREYPSTWQEALESAGDRMFSSEDLDACGIDSLGVWETQREYEERWQRFFAPPDVPRPRKRKYSIGVDIGLKSDATVICVLDVTEELIDVVGFRRLLQPSVGDVQKAIEDMFARWPSAHVSIEDSGIGYPIRQGVKIREERLHGVLTTGVSKPRMLGELQVLIEQQYLRYDAKALPQLDRELRSYTTPDTHITTDCVMALAFAVNGAEHAVQSSAGRILGVYRV
jgi:hypothetical protein